MSIRLDTFEALRGAGPVHAAPTGLMHPANATLSRLIAEGVEPHGTKLVYPCELEDRLGIRVQPDSAINAIVFPSFDDGLDGPALRRLSSSEAENNLAELHFDNPVQHAGFVPRAEFPVDMERQRAILEHVCRIVPAYEFRYSFSRLRTDARRLKEALNDEIGRRPHQREA